MLKGYFAVSLYSLFPEGDWETAHYIMTGDSPQEGATPQLPYPVATSQGEPALGGGDPPMVPFGGMQQPDANFGGPQLTFGLGTSGEEVGVVNCSGYWVGEFPLTMS